MNDVIIAQLFILIMLFFPLVQAFIPKLKNIQGFSFFPVLALFACVCVFLGRICSLVCICISLFSFLCCIVETDRLIQYVQGLHAGEYGIAGRILRALFLLIWAFLVWLTIAYAPQEIYHIKNPVQIQVVYMPVKSRVKAFNLLGRKFLPLEESKRRVLVLTDAVAIERLSYLSTDKKNVPSGGLQHVYSLGTTVSRVLVDNSYSVLELDVGMQLRFLQGCGGNTLRFLLNRIDSVHMRLPDEAETLLLQKIQAANIDAPVPVFAEGSSAEILLSLVQKFPKEAEKLFSGLFLFIDKNKKNDFSSSARIPIFLCQAEEQDFSGFGDLAAEDPLLAWLYTGSFDKGRNRRIALAQEFDRWIQEIETVYFPSFEKAVNNESN